MTTSKAKQATCDSIIRWLHGNPQPLDQICHQFSLGRQRFANLRCSQAWHDAEAALNMAVERPVRQVDANGDVTYLYEATEVISEGMTVRGLLVAMSDTTTRLDTIMARTNIYEGNETDQAAALLLGTIINNTLLMISNIKSNVGTMERIEKYLAGQQAATTAAAAATTAANATP